MSVTDFLSIFKHLSPHHSQIMACPVLIRTSSNTLPAPQKHIGSGCLLHMVIIWHHQQSRTCTVVPLAVSCRHSMVWLLLPFIPELIFSAFSAGCSAQPVTCSFNPANGQNLSKCYLTWEMSG